MTQNDLNFLQDALGIKCSKLLTEIVNNENTVRQLKEAQAEAEEQPKETKKSVKKESK